MVGQELATGCNCLCIRLTVTIQTGEHEGGEPAVKERVTTSYMTKYERARVLGARALQIRCGIRRAQVLPRLPGVRCELIEQRFRFWDIPRDSLAHTTTKAVLCCNGLRPPRASRSMGAPIMVQLEGETDPLQIAHKELKQKKIPIVIRRYRPVHGRFRRYLPLLLAGLILMKCRTSSAWLSSHAGTCRMAVTKTGPCRN
jgi:DNA-directed RNA polymerase subunit K/omega